RPNLTQPEIDQFLAHPKGPVAATLLAGATTRVVYDLTAYWQPDPKKKLPVVAATVARETHISQVKQNQESKLQVSLSYVDGFGREIQRKLPAERGPVPKRDSNGKVMVGPDDQPVLSTDDVGPRWSCSGWTLLSNHGLPVRQFESFFTDTHRFEFDVRIG